MKTFLLSLGSLLLALPFSTRSEAALPPGFDAGQWTQLTQKITREGTFSRLPLGITLSLSRGTPGEGTMNYLTAQVAEERGVLVINQVTAVTETTSFNEQKERMVDQRLYWISEFGDVQRVAYFQLRFSPENTLLERKELFYGRAPEADELNRWAAELTAWYQTLP